MIIRLVLGKGGVTEGSWGAEGGGRPRRLDGVGVGWMWFGKLVAHSLSVCFSNVRLSPQEGWHLGHSHYFVSQPGTELARSRCSVNTTHSTNV